MQKSKPNTDNISTIKFLFDLNNLEYNFHTAENFEKDFNKWNSVFIKLSEDLDLIDQTRQKVVSHLKNLNEGYKNFSKEETLETTDKPEAEPVKKKLKNEPETLNVTDKTNKSVKKKLKNEPETLVATDSTETTNSSVKKKKKKKNEPETLVATNSTETTDSSVKKKKKKKKKNEPETLVATDSTETTNSSVKKKNKIKLEKKGKKEKKEKKKRNKNKVAN